MIDGIKAKIFRKKFTGIINLPADGLSDVVEHYGQLKGDSVPMQLVVIYNTKQLATEIAKALKDSTSNCGKSNNDSN